VGLIDRAYYDWARGVFEVKKKDWERGSLSLSGGRQRLEEKGTGGGLYYNFLGRGNEEKKALPYSPGWAGVGGGG